MDLSETKQLQPVELDGPAKLLLKAAAVIERDGWCQNDIQTFDGRVCLAGAVKRAAGVPLHNFVWDEESEEAMDRMNRQALQEGFVDAPRWNDMIGRTKEEVVAKLCAVALAGA